MSGVIDSLKNERLELLKAFDETKAGVKGVLDSGLQKIPKIFIRPSEDLEQDFPHEKNPHQFQIPVIDLSEIHNTQRRKKTIEEVGIAAEKWGFFQIVNHGIPLTVLDQMIEGVRKFNEEDVEEKKKYYSRDFNKKARFSSNYDLYTSKTANWRDTLQIMVSENVGREELPASCRDSTIDYAQHVHNLGTTLFGLLSEALGLKSDHLKDMECSNQFLSCHYYPACPETELTLGATKHSDPAFLTILLQNHITSGLQILYQGQWIDIQPIRGCLVINIGDLLQLVSNGKFKSIEHRVIANQIGPRISVACFFSGPRNGFKIYGPIKELVSEENPPAYKEVEMSEYLLKFSTTGLDNYRALDYYKV